MKKKGFTLIELLAVIVILAIIALIAAPLVLKYIEKSRKESKVDSAYSFVRNLETEIANYAIKNNGEKYTTDKENIKELGINTTVKGENPDDGNVCISSLGQIEKGVFKYNEGKYYVLYDGKKGSIIDEATYTNFSCNATIKEESGLYDAEGNLIASWNELVNDYGIDLESDYMGDDQSRPGYILSINEKLSKGVKLIIDDSVTEIGNEAFHGCTSLIEIIVSDSVTSTGYGVFASCTKLKKVAIGSGLTVINEFVFENCTSLEEVIIGNNVTKIEVFAFMNCTSLEKIIIPNRITRIGANAFDRCTSLTEVVIGDSVTHIDDCAFINCTSLKEVTIPKSITNIAIEAFALCEKLKTINYTGSQADWDAIQFEDDWNYGWPSDHIINYNYVVQ